jgi:hypothetical protein
VVGGWVLDVAVVQELLKTGREDVVEFEVFGGRLEVHARPPAKVETGHYELIYMDISLGMGRC